MNKIINILNKIPNSISVIISTLLAIIVLEIIFLLSVYISYKLTGFFVNIDILFIIILITLFHIAAVSLKQMIEIEIKNLKK